MTQSNYNNFSVLPFYDSIEQQNARKWWINGRVYPLFTQAGFILPFQFMIPHKSNPNMSSFLLYDANTDKQVENITTALEATGAAMKQFNNFDVVLHPGAVPTLPNVLNGRYYIVATVNSVKYYSEIFTVVNDISPYLKISWWDVDDFVMDAGTIVYTYANGSQFKNYLYLKADIAKPEYLFEEEGETRDGYFYPIKQISEKRYKFSFLASEYLLDVMRFIRMADFVEIEKDGNLYKPDTFLITPEWEAGGDVAAVQAEFDTDTVAKKLGSLYTPPTGRGDFNNDYNNDYFNKQ